LDGQVRESKTRKDREFPLELQKLFPPVQRGREGGAIKASSYRLLDQESIFLGEDSGAGKRQLPRELDIRGEGMGREP